ncbi:MAG: hypothetical protein SF187_28855 [Deltaproteobacteria bacterium]|nr:hypothetical protein [Deltaproteobacteria bacterium]
MTAAISVKQLPRVVANFDRAGAIPADYSAGRHIATTLTLSAIIITAAMFLAVKAQPIDWLLLPAFWLAGNFIEWAFHKGPMHRPTKARILYVNHTLIHHRAFLHNTMPVQNFREFGLILMPWYTMMLLLVLASPIAVAAWAWRGPGAVGIFYLFAMSYFLFYEVLHGLYHTPEAFQRRFGLWNNRVFKFLQHHHAHHHRLDRMSHKNFNVTVPLFDTLMGTREKPGLDADAHATAEAWDQEMGAEERKEAEK